MPHYIQDHNGISVASQPTTHPPLYVVLLFASASATSHQPPPSMHPFVFYTSRLIAPSRFSRALLSRARDFAATAGPCRMLLVASIRDVKLIRKFRRKNAPRAIPGLFSRRSDGALLKSRSNVAALTLLTQCRCRAISIFLLARCHRESLNSP